MSAESNQRIEEELKACAARRRAEAGPPLELPAATRRVLQDEVAQSIAQPQGAGASSGGTDWWRWFWPKLAVAAGVGLVLLAVVLQVPRSKSKASYEMAKAKDPVERQTTDQLARREGLESSPEPTSTPEGGQRFTQVSPYRRNFNSPPPPGVLQSFRLRRDQQQLVVEDADGSVYRGSVQPAQSQAARQTFVTTRTRLADRARPESQEAPAPAAVPLAGGAVTELPAIDFLVAGTNLTLNQLVVFEGQIIASTNEPAAAGGGTGGTGLAPDGQAASYLNLVTQGEASLAIRQAVFLGRVQGQAVIGETTRVEINAVPVRP